MATEFTINNYGLLVDEEVRAHLKKRFQVDEEPETFANKFIDSIMSSYSEFVELTHLDGCVYEVDSNEPHDQYGYFDIMDCPHRLFIILAKNSPNLFSQSYGSKEDLANEIRETAQCMLGKDFDIVPHLARFSGAIEVEKKY